MTFEEFFNRKRIDLVALRAAEPALYAEFEKHFNQMGEKSFDHTKKYWFNKLRLQYHLAPEQKPEKVHLENKLAEQTIAETLTDNVPAPSVGFKPRFKPGMGKAADATNDQKVAAQDDSATATPEVNAAVAAGDQLPPFQQEKEAMQAAADATPRTTDAEEEEKQTQGPATKPAGFKPRFSMKMTQGNAPQTKKVEAEPKTEEPGDLKQTEATKPAGFKPRFNMKTMAPKPAAATDAPAETESAEDKLINESGPIEPVAPTTPKIGFKPRFNAKTTKPKPPEE
ncbi:hypothetical protein GWR56_02255 [Mucilaginibacter sp. 14171R-50]|uniref:hypothetical protein n=1 Tax=Mucilaginibacter sp. 14171R-50 TaxID=2703789 RepID=UPI00138BA267|nr:hypothetical protein [Mucilaginibacter sp. 14171R-50]QHS54419.1 hypothetical protein GWR56_02255 [Mucilaginibacter sp. 14171R-50]